MAASVEVSVEAVIENQIQEVTLDGQELYVQPLSMSENLTKLACKIDFSEDEKVEKGRPTSEGEKDDEEKKEKTITPFQPSLWPWDSVRNKLKAALTETSVLLDVLNIVKEKRYMVLDPVQQETPESKTGMHLLAKKKALSIASSILSSGSERLRKPQMDIATKRNQQEYHYELLRLRQNWRLKKVGNTILGDLSYKSAGSRFWQSGTFEVTKSDGESTDVLESPVGMKPQSALQVHVPSELEGVAYIQVAIKRIADNVDLSSVNLKLPTDISGTVPSDAHWQRKLEAAQNVIFCKEVFQQLAREAVQVKNKVPHMVVGNQIFTHLFPGLQLSIALCHNTDKERRGSHMTAESYRYGKQLGFSSVQQSPSLQQKPEHNHVLEHSLHQLLREVHFKNLYHPMPHPITGLVGMSKRRRLAGPHALSRQDLIEMSETETLLQQIIKQARHIVMRQRAMFVIDDLAQTVQDPQIAAHWSNISCATESLVKIHITSQGYENVRTPVALHIGINSMRAVCKDGRVFNLSYEEQELRDFLMCQIAQHHVSAIQSLAKMMGWTVLSVNTHIGVGNMEPIGNALSLIAASPNGDRVLSIRSGPESGLRVSVQMSPWKPEDNGSSTVIRNSKWSHLGGPFKPVHLEKIDGKNIVNKVELLMACFTKDGQSKTESASNIFL